VADALFVQGLCVRERHTGSLIVDGFGLRLAVGRWLAWLARRDPGSRPLAMR